MFMNQAWRHKKSGLSAMCVSPPSYVLVIHFLFLNQVWQAWVFKVSLLIAVPTMQILAGDPNWLAVPGVTCMAGTQVNRRLRSRVAVVEIRHAGSPSGAVPRVPIRLKLGRDTMLVLRGFQRMTFRVWPPCWTKTKSAQITCGGFWPGWGWSYHPRLCSAIPSPFAGGGGRGFHPTPLPMVFGPHCQ